MLGLDAARLVAGDADDVVRDPGLLDALTGVSPLADRTILVAHAAMGIVDVPRPFARHDLVRFPRRAIEVEEELEGRREPAGPVARQAGTLIPDVEAEAAPALLPHPVEPPLPIGLPLVVAVDQSEIDQDLAVVGHHVHYVTEDALHECVPVTDASGRVVALVGIGR